MLSVKIYFTANRNTVKIPLKTLEGRRNNYRL